jgi:hypothetical protein
MELNAKIYRINETQKVSDSFSKREFIVETDGQYKQYILLQVVKDKCAVLDGYKIGENVTVSLNINGRLWTNPQGDEKCFNTLDCWKISKTETQSEMPPAPTQEEENSDIPF